MGTRKIPIIFLFIFLFNTISSSFFLIPSANKTTFSKEINFLQKFNVFGVAPSYLQPGDIVCCEIRDFLVKLGGHDVAPGDKFGFDHVALYRGKGRVTSNNRFIMDDKFGIDYVIEATFLPFPGVRYTPLFLLLLYSNLYFAKVTNADYEIRQGAIDFAEGRLGDEYQHFWYADGVSWHANNNYDDENDINSNKWYCAELVWASYYNQGIDLDPIFPDDHDADGIPDYDENMGYLRFVSPKNIYLSNNTTRY
jgi:hypothetical protein